VEKEQFQAALSIYEEISKTDSGDAETWFMLGMIYSKLGRYHQAIECCQKAITIEPNNAAAYYNMGISCQALSKLNEAQACYQKAIKIQPDIPGIHFSLGVLFKEQGLFDAAEQSFQDAVRSDPSSAQACFQLGVMLTLQSRVEEAINAYDKVLSLSDSIPEAYWNKLRCLPVIYDNEDQITFYRNRYTDGLKLLSEGLALDTVQGKLNALKGISTNSNFYLQYQEKNDKELQKQYGEIVHRIMAANYPQWVVPLDMPPLEPNDKIRIGYTSTFLRDHNGAVWLLGWLQNRDKKQFEVHCYHTGTRVDAKTEIFKSCCDHFHHIPGDLEKACEQITTDKLHILVYPELGMDAFNMMMAGLRLAPVQCVGWGHPITSGLPTMDYWLSSDLMEPENGQEHYTEKLVRLPNMAHCYSSDQHDRLQSRPPQKKRSDFNLREDAVLYLCSQSLFKYLPQYDYLLPEIAKRVPNTQFVFLAISSVYVVRQFMQRMDRAFSNAGLKAQDFCIMLNRLSPDDYLNLNQVADIFLDNPPWSGNNTTLAAIDCHLPVVTLPTKYMRGRHSYAILKMLGVTETIAESADEYIEIAANLGLDSELRKNIKEKISNCHNNICNDTSCVKELEKFYVKALKEIQLKT